MNKPNELQPADHGEILFAAAIAQGRADAIKAAAVKAAKELAIESDPVIARMLASFARQREWSKRQEQVPFANERTQAEVDAEINYNLDRAESMAINAGRY